MRENPAPEASVTLVVEVDPDRLDRETLSAQLDSLDGGLEADLPFDSYRVRLPESSVDSFCETAGLETVETANVLGRGDAGEDVD